MKKSSKVLYKLMFFLLFLSSSGMEKVLVLRTSQAVARVSLPLGWEFKPTEKCPGAYSALLQKFSEAWISIVCAPLKKESSFEEEWKIVVERFLKGAHHIVRTVRHMDSHISGTFLFKKDSQSIRACIDMFVNNGKYYMFFLKVMNEAVYKDAQADYERMVHSFKVS